MQHQSRTNIEFIQNLSRTHAQNSFRIHSRRCGCAGCRDASARRRHCRNKPCLGPDRVGRQAQPATHARTRPTSRRAYLAGVSSCLVRFKKEVQEVRSVRRSEQLISRNFVRSIIDSKGVLESTASYPTTERKG